MQYSNTFFLILLCLGSYTVSSCMTKEEKLLRAILDQDIASVRQLIKEVNVNTPLGLRNATPLIVAAAIGNETIFDLIFNAGADVNAQDDDGYTALITATHAGYLPLVKKLIAKKANLNLQTTGRYAPVPVGSTALMLAIKHQRHIASDLIKAGADTNIADVHGWTPLMYATRIGNENLFDQLLTAQADVNAQTQKGITALIIASFLGHHSLVKKLIQHKTDLNKQLTKNYTDFEPTLPKGTTALMIATQKNYTNIIHELISAGAKLDLQNAVGETALSIARRLNNKKSISILKQKIITPSNTVEVLIHLTKKLHQLHKTLKGTL